MLHNIVVESESSEKLNSSNSLPLIYLIDRKQYARINSPLLFHVFKQNINVISKLYHVLISSLSFNGEPLTQSIRQWQDRLNCSIDSIVAAQAGLTDLAHFDCACISGQPAI